MEALFDGRDTLAVLPTGFGKSLIYQGPALMLEGPTLVISPLIALMRDQEQSLLKRNVPVVRLDRTRRRESSYPLEKRDFGVRSLGAASPGASVGGWCGRASLHTPCSRVQGRRRRWEVR